MYFRGANVSLQTKLIPDLVNKTLSMICQSEIVSKNYSYRSIVEEGINFSQNFNIIPFPDSLYGINCIICM